MKKTFLTLLILIFLNSCGYTPLLINENNNFKYKSASISGNEKISELILGNIEKFNDESSNNNINLSSSYSKYVSSKDSKGNPSTFNMVVNVTISIENNGNVKMTAFQESINYNNNSNKFKLKNYENKIKTNLINKISQDIIIFLQSI